MWPLFLDTLATRAGVGPRVPWLALPTDKPIVVMCHSGTRATAAATALRQIGFDETYVVKGGFTRLIGYLGAKEANQPLGPQAAAR